MSYAHSEADISRALSVYDEVFALLRESVCNNEMHRYLKCVPLQPLFKVR